MFQGTLNSVSRKFKRRFKEVSRKCQESFNGLQEWLKGVSRKGVLKEFSVSLKGISKLF